MTLLEDRPVEAVRKDRRPVIETERLVLRTPRPSDAGAIAALVNDRRIAENTARIPHPYTLQDAEHFIMRAADGGELSFAITLAEGTLVGGCGLMRPHGPDPEIGYWLGVPFWGRGYATEAAGAMTNHALTVLGHETMVAGARVSNPASRRVLEKCGFAWTGVRLQRSLALRSSVPVDRFRLDRVRWESLQTPGTISPAG